MLKVNSNSANTTPIDLFVSVLTDNFKNIQQINLETLSWNLHKNFGLLSFKVLIQF